MSGRFDDLKFFGQWRPYQRAALAAFERDRAQGNLSTHIVAPPGSGKTLLGVELIRRVGKRALVLAPNQGIQQQWPRAVGEFTPNPAAVAGADPLKPIACLSYQALCQLEDPEIVLGRLAQSRWADERAAATGMTPEEAMREGEAFEGAAADRRARELSRISAALKREVARGEHAGVELRDMLSTTAKQRVQQLAKMGVGVVLLDECHHLASLWGYVVRAVLGELGEKVHVIGLTATPPVGLPEAEAELYAALLGPVDFTVPTPAVVRDGHLAPYQELAWLTEPLKTEREWLAEHDSRFRELITALHDDAESDISFPRWVGSRMRDRKRSPDDDAEVPWEAFQKRSPKLARAGIRFLLSAGLEIPSGAPRGEAYRQQPDLEDWLVLLEDYALRCLASSETRGAGERYDAIAAALRELGFQLTRKGIRRGTSEVDRLLTGSQAKALGLVEVLSAEADTRGDALRALVLCDAELASQRPDDALTGVLDPAAGTARHALLAIASDSRTAPMRPLLVSGRGLRCAPQDADVLLEALRVAAEERFTLPEWEAEVDGLLASLQSSGAEWMPRAWVELATTLLVEGTTSVLVGTRALLGEGWNCRPLNVLVDMTIATTGVSVQQMRGRTLRLDPADPQKLSSNWDVVCVAPDMVRGTADYERFVRKHLHLFAPAEDGEIEAGPSHVHPEMGPFAPPPVEHFGALNAAQLARASDRAAARELWQVGTPYRGVELPTLLVRPSRPDVPAPAVGGSSRGVQLSQKVPIAGGVGGAAVFAALGLATGTPV
ncbi:MAG TPA: DEAD/DEAH box helicase family protein, partial [Solirubrobacter sp.]